MISSKATLTQSVCILALWCLLGGSYIWAADPAANDPLVQRMKSAEASRDAIYEKQGVPAALAQFQADVEKLIVEFPGRSEPYKGLYEVALALPDPASRQMFERISNAPAAGAKLHATAKAEIVRLDLVGNPRSPAAIAQYRTDMEKLIVEFPGQSEPYEGLYEVALDVPDSASREIFERIANAPPAGSKLQAAAKAQIGRLDLVGKPLDLKFTALDGRSVDLAALRGKVVVIDFWATWCGPCMRELPSLKETISKFKDRGVEIVGISLDKDRDKLASVVTRENMFWPQAFDGKQWQGDLVTRFGIRSIPSLWLVDQHGVLRDTLGRQDLAGKLETMLKN